MGDKNKWESDFALIDIFIIVRKLYTFVIKKIYIYTIFCLYYKTSRKCQINNWKFISTIFFLIAENFMSLSDLNN